MFPLEKILFALATDSKATRSILESIKPKVTHFITQEVYIDVFVSFCLQIAKIREREMDLRKKVMNAGVKVGHC